MPRIALAYSAAASATTTASAGSTVTTGSGDGMPFAPTVSLNIGAGDAAEAVIVILMMVQDGDQDLQEKMLEAQAQMAAKQALRRLITEMQNLESSMPLQGQPGTPPATDAVTTSMLTSINFSNVPGLRLVFNIRK